MGSAAAGISLPHGSGQGHPAWLRSGWSLVRRHPVLAAILGAALLAVALRAPWFGAPLGNDEGGLAYIAEHARSGGPNLFGFYFIDRPPLLLGIFHIAVELGGAAAVRAVGALAAVALVAIVALVARELAGRSAAIWGAFIAAILGSSPFLLSVFTPAELLAVVPSASSVLFLLIGVRSAGGRRLACFALAGLLAAAAVLVKQSFGDAFVAAFACFLAGLYFERPAWRYWLPAVFAYIAGALVPVFALELWEHLYRVPDGAVSYALLHFRIDGLDTLSTSAHSVLDRFYERVVVPALISGLVLVAAAALIGFRRLGSRRVAQATVAGWAAGGIAGIALGGSYWAHYLIELVPVVAATAGVAVASSSVPLRRVGAAAIGAGALATVLIGPGASTATVAATKAERIGDYIAERARPSDSIYVLYSQPNIIYYSGLRSPYPYSWSLMVRTVHGAQDWLRQVLRTDAGPTWIAKWEKPTDYGLDDNGRPASLLRRHYRKIATVHRTPILLRNGVDPLPARARSSVPR